jgi:hypothetical protein
MTRMSGRQAFVRDSEKRKRWPLACQQQPESSPEVLFLLVFVPDSEFEKKTSNDAAAARGRRSLLAPSATQPYFRKAKVSCRDEHDCFLAAYPQ